MFTRLNSIDEEVAKAEEDHIPRCMIHPNKKPKTSWNLLLIILMFYTAIFMPYKIAFVEAEFGDAWFVIDLIVDVFFATDIIVNCFSAYYDKEDFIVTDRK